MACALGGQSGLVGAGFGVIQGTHHLIGDKIIRGAVDEQHRLFTVLHLLQGGCFLKAIARFGSCRGAGGIQNWELRQAEPQFQLTGKNIPHAGVAAVLHKHFYLFRGVLPCCHHGGGGTHGNAVQHNFSFAVLRQHPVDPLQHILAVQPAHADIIALTVAAGAQIRGQHLVACIVVVLGQVGHAGMAAAVAVQGNHPQVAARIGVIHAVQPQAVRCRDLHRLAGILLQKFLIGLLLYGAVFGNQLFHAIRGGFHIQRHLTVTAVPAAPNGIIDQVAAGKRNDRRHQHHHGNQHANDNLSSVLLFCCNFHSVFLSLCARAICCTFQSRMFNIIQQLARMFNGYLLAYSGLAARVWVP